MDADTTKHPGSRPGPPAVEIADATRDDAPDVIAVLHRSYAEFRPAFAPTALRETAATVGAAPAEWLLARDADRLVGCVRHRQEDDDRTFAFLAVVPDDRRRGIGSALVEAVADRAELAGARELAIVLRDGLAANVAFFRRRGFRRVRAFSTGEHSVYVRRLGGATWPAP